MNVYICIGSSCYLKGSRDIITILERLINIHNVKDKVTLMGSFCMGHCVDSRNQREPVQHGARGAFVPLHLLQPHRLLLRRPRLHRSSSHRQQATRPAVPSWAHSRSPQPGLPSWVLLRRRHCGMQNLGHHKNCSVNQS